MEIIKNKNFGTHNTSVRSGKIEYIAIHYVGGSSDADDNVAYFNNRNVTNASADYFVSFNGDIYEYNPDPEARYSWAVGGKKLNSYGVLHGKATNANSVSIEMCVKFKGSKAPKSPNDPDWYFTEATINSTVELTKYLMEKHNVPASKVIRHFDVTGKVCPGVVGWNAASGSEKDWLAFKARLTEAPVETPVKTPVETKSKLYRVRKSWEDAKSQIGAFEILANAKALADKNPGYKVFNSKGVQVYPEIDKSFKVRVDITTLRIRAGAGLKYKIERFIPKGVYTIMETKDADGYTWGRLKSGAGWIALEYVKRL